MSHQIKAFPLVSISTVILLVISVLTPLAFAQEGRDRESRTLPPNKKLEVLLKGGEKHSYKIKLKAGEYFHADVNQRGIDVVLSIVNRDGQTQLERDRPNNTKGQESLSFLAQVTGEYRLHIKALDDKVAAGQYEISSEPPRLPTLSDKKRIEAESLLQDGLRLSQTETKEPMAATCSKYDAAVLLWREINDKYAEALTQTSLGYCRESVKENEKAIAAHDRALTLYRDLQDRDSEASSLANLSALNALAQKPDLALAHYRQAKAIYRDLKDPDAEAEMTKRFRRVAEIYLQAGGRLLQQGKAETYAAAIRILTIAREMFHESDDVSHEALSLIGLGRLNNLLGERQKAAEFYNQSASLYRAIGDKGGEGAALNNIGAIHHAFGEDRKALEFFALALPLRRAANDQIGEAATLDNIGVAYFSLSEHRKAIESFNQAVRLYHATGDKKRASLTLNNLGVAHSHLGEFQQALDFYDRALALTKEAGDKATQAITLDNFGLAYYKLGENERALEYHNLALPLRRDVKDQAGEAATLNNLGLANSALGESEKALDYYDQALRLRRVVKDKSGEAKTLNNFGLEYAKLGEYQKALDYYEKQALPLTQEIKDQYSEAATLNNLGSLFATLGEHRKALEYYKAALSPLSVVDRYSEAVTLSNIGLAYFRLGDTQNALDYLNQALPLRRSIGDKPGEAATLVNIGSVYSGLGEYRKALEYHLNQALPLIRGAGDKVHEATTLNDIGVVYSKLKDYQNALEYFRLALPLSRAVRDKSGEAVTLNNMAVVWGSLKNARLAILCGKQSIIALEQLRDTTRRFDSATQRTFLKSVEDPYRNLALVLLEEERLAEAVGVLNAFKDQQYFDFNREAVNKHSPLTFSPREAEFDLRYSEASDKVGNIGRQIEAVKRTLGRGTTDQEASTKLQQLETALKVATDEYLAVFKQAELEFKRPADIKDKVPVVNDAREMQSALRRFGRKAVVIYTLVGEDKFHALVLSPNDMMAVSSPIKRTRISSQAKQLSALLRSDEYDPKPLSSELYDAIFKPIKNKLIKEKKLIRVLPEGTTIMWSLDGDLRYLPMAALYDGQKYQVERYNNVVFTRAEIERLTRIPSRNWTGTGFGNSRGGTVEHLKLAYTFDALPNATTELNAIFRRPNSRSGVFDGIIFPDSSFTREAMIAALSEHRPLVHIASHFIFSPGDEARSFLLLGDGKVFPLDEMKKHPDFFRGVELLTLSACETAAQWANSEGREVDGFAELAQRLGAGAVIASLWNVSDDSTYWLMSDFYRKKRDVPEQTKSGALRQAQIALLYGAAKVLPLTNATDATANRRNSVTIKILPAGKEYPDRTEEGVVYIEARFAQPYQRDDSRPYAHPYFWSPFILFGNWR